MVGNNYFGIDLSSKQTDDLEDAVADQNDVPDTIEDKKIQKRKEKERQSEDHVVKENILITMALGSSQQMHREENHNL